MFGTGDREAARRVEGLALYQYDACPFCMRVRMAMRSLGVDIELRDTRTDREHAAELAAAMGRTTVPVLRIEEGDEVRWLPESAEIVAYLRERFG
jgi:glutathione S-transferase